MHFTVESFSPVTADEVTEREDSAGDLEEDKLSAIRNLYFEDSEEDESGSAGDSEEDEPRSAGDSEEDESGSTGDSEEDESGSAGDSEEDESGSAGDSEEDESGSAGDSEEDESGSARDSEEDEPDPRVQEAVGSRDDDISNSIEICDFLI